MNLNPSSPLHKLQRIKEIERELRGHEPPPAPWLPEPQKTLIAERNAILSTVGLPPPELEGASEPELWAGSFSTVFPNVDLDTALAWFEAAMNGARSAGVREGRTRGLSENAERLGMPRLVATLELVRDGLKANAIRSQGIVNVDNPNGPRRPLVERIVEDLAAVGVTE